MYGTSESVFTFLHVCVCIHTCIGPSFPLSASMCMHVAVIYMCTVQVSRFGNCAVAL
jgi:hypothetical protein